MSAQPIHTDDHAEHDREQMLDRLAAFAAPMPADVLDRIRQRLAVEHASRYIKVR